MSQHHKNRSHEIKVRELLKPQVASGNSICPRCGQPITPRQHWDAGHAIDLAKNPNQQKRPPEELVRDGLIRPEHRKCNRAAGARAGNKARGKTKRSFSQTGNRPAQSNAEYPQGYGSRERVATDRALAGRGVAVADAPVVRDDGLVLPRLETPAAGLDTLGGLAADWIDQCGILPGTAVLRAWQRYVLERALEVNPDGSLRWPVVVVTTARQSGKSWLLRALMWWRLHQAERYGEPQQVLSTSNLLNTAVEIWMPAGRLAVEQYGREATAFGNGRQCVTLPDTSRWMVQAAGPNTGVGFSLSLAVIDEAWKVARSTAEDSLAPALAEREQPQMWLVSTAGDSGSDLLRSYRDQALADKDGTGQVLLLEWSAPEAAPYDAPDTWRWASPEWSERRHSFLETRLTTQDENTFCTQYLNRWVMAADGWMPPGVWAAGYSDTDTPDTPPDVVAVERSQDARRLGLVAAWRVGEQVLVRGHITNSTHAAWAKVDEWAPRLLLVTPQLGVHYTGKRRPTVVGTQELGRHLVGVGRTIADGDVLHSPDDHALNGDVGRAVAVTTETGLRLSEKKSPGPTECARALVFAAGELLKPAAPRPQVVTA